MFSYRGSGMYFTDMKPLSSGPDLRIRCGQGGSLEQSGDGDTHHHHVLFGGHAVCVRGRT